MVLDPGVKLEGFLASWSRLPSAKQGGLSRPASARARSRMPSNNLHARPTLCSHVSHVRGELEEPHRDARLVDGLHTHEAGQTLCVAIVTVLVFVPRPWALYAERHVALAQAISASLREICLHSTEIISQGRSTAQDNTKHPTWSRQPGSGAASLPTGRTSTPGSVLVLVLSPGPSSKHCPHPAFWADL